MAAEGAIESSTPVPGSFSGIKESRTSLMVSWKGHKKQLYLVGGFNPSEKYEFVSWDDDIPIYYGKIKTVPNHQPDYHQY